MGSHPFLSSNHICFSVKLPGRPSQISRGAMLSQRPDLGSADSALRLLQTEHSVCDRQIWGSQEGSGDSEVAGAAQQRQGLSRLSSVHLMLASVLRRIA